MNASDPIRIGLILIFVPRNRFILYILQSSKSRLGEVFMWQRIDAIDA